MRWEKNATAGTYASGGMDAMTLYTFDRLCVESKGVGGLFS